MAGKKTQAQLTPEEKLQQALVPEAEQPYKVPANWCWTRLEVINSYNERHIDPSKNLQEFFELYSVVSYVNSYPELVNGSVIGSTKLCVQKNDVLLCKINPRINRVWKVEKYTDNILIASSEWIVIRNEKFISDYLLWCFRSEYFRKYMMLNVSGVGGSLMRAKPKFVKTYPIPLPPLAEQQRIVERIESLFAKLDEAKEKLQNVLDGFETRKAAILHKAFTGELTANWRKQHGVSMESWESVKVSNLCENIVCGKTPTSYIDNNGDIPYLKVYNIVNNKIDFDSKPQYIPKKIHESKLKSSILKPKDVIMNIVGPPLRKIAIIPDTYPEWNMNQAIVRFRTKEKLYYKYLYYYLIYPKTLDDIICETKGVVGQANISITQSRNLNINLPTFSEQTEIVRIIDELFVKEQQAKELAENALAKIEIIKKAILARAFCGELGTNNPADEPAVELLKRVL